MNLRKHLSSTAPAGRKRQRTIHIDPETDQALQAFCDDRRVSLSLAVSDAVRAKLFPEQDPDRNLGAQPAPELDALLARIDALEQEVMQGQELLALYIQMWFIYDTPQLTQEEYNQRSLIAKQRFDRFMEAFSLRFAQGDSLIERYQSGDHSEFDSEVANGHPQ